MNDQTGHDEWSDGGDIYYQLQGKNNFFWYGSEIHFPAKCRTPASDKLPAKNILERLGP